jgi:hypothetical protein
MDEERGLERTVARFVRACIYNRWFYALLAAVCLLDVTADGIALARPKESYGIEVISLVASAITAVLTTTVFLDLQFRRRKP